MGVRPGAPVLVWFRRDLRDYDHAALAAALGEARDVHCAFVFDTEILEPLARDDARVTFIHECVVQLEAALRRRGGGLHVLHDRAREAIPRLAAELHATAVYANRDYEAAAMDRDAEVSEQLRSASIELRTFKDQVIFEAHEVTKADGQAYSVFTPYKRAWMKKLDARAVSAHDARVGRLCPAAGRLPDLSALGFEAAPLAREAGMAAAANAWATFRRRLGEYAERRDFPALAATSGLSVHLRFGTLSIRELVREAMARRGAGAEAWLGELAWREFFFAILSTRPDVTGHAFHREYDALRWGGDEGAWQAWREGRTGYPLVDAAMRELAVQGTMHNRLRMVTASFLVKDLSIDWRRGERYFAERLLDYDLAANNGNWQWCASTGCDAQPWFRIFNPVTQSRRFDPDGAYIRRWLPELVRVPNKRVHAPWEMTEPEQGASGCRIGRDYPAPVVAHEEARRRTLERYAAVRK